MPTRPRSIPVFWLPWLPWLLALLVLAAGARRATEIRASALDRYPLPGDNLWRINATQSLQIARNWYSDGLAANGFLMRFRLEQAENPTAGYPYLSYPPGFALAVWGASEVTGTPPNLRLVNSLGEICQWASATLLLLLTGAVATQLGLSSWMGAALGSSVGLASIFLPGALAFFPFAWWADIVVLPIFLGLLACETVLSPWQDRRFFRAVRAALVIAGVFCDWLFFILLAALLLRDWTARPRRWRPELVRIPGLYLLFHAALILEAGFVTPFLVKLAQRTGVSAPGVTLARGVVQWLTTVRDGLTGAGLVLYLASLAAVPLVCLVFARRERIPQPERGWVELVFLALVPVHLHSLLLHQHYYGHSYNVVKFALIVPLFWIGLVPALLLRRVRRALWYRALRASSVRILSVGAQLGFLALLAAGTWRLRGELADRYEILFGNPENLSRTLQDHCREVFLHSAPDDIAFSPDFATDDSLRLNAGGGDVVAEWALAPCNRRVYLARAPGDLARLFVQRGWIDHLIGAPYRLRLWTVGPPSAAWSPFLVPGSFRKYGELESYELPRSLFTSADPPSSSKNPDHE